MNKIAIIENSKGLGIFFTKLLDDKEYEIFPVWKTHNLPEEKYDAYIFTGDFNNMSDGLLPIHRKEIDYVKKIKDKKIFGSCFFHQLLGEVYGGKVRKRVERFFGWKKMQIQKRHQILNGLNNPCFLNLNVDEIIEKPKDAIILATNPGCKYQALQYGENIFTCQSHPEIFRNEGLELIEKHKTSLQNRCPGLEKIVKETEKFAVDKANIIFLSNMTKWLLS